MNAEASRLGRWLQLVGLLMFVAAAIMTGVVGPARSAVAAGAVTLNPSTGLTDGQTIAVHGTGFPSNTPMQLLECAGTVASPPPDAASSCEGLTLETPQDVADGTGNYSTSFTVYVLPGPTVDTSAITCDSTHSCVLYVGADKTNFSGAFHVFAQLGFGQTSATTTAAPTTTAGPTTTAMPTTTAAPTTTSSTTSSTSSTTSTTKLGATTTTARGATTTTPRCPSSTTTSPATSTTAHSTSTTAPGSTSSTSPPSTSSTSTTVRSTTTTVCSSTMTFPPAGGGATPTVVDPAGAVNVAGATLPFSGQPTAVPVLALTGLVAIGLGSGVRRRVLRPAGRRIR